jgi:PadR family transcriptional regulator PadR
MDRARATASRTPASGLTSRPDATRDPLEAGAIATTTVIERSLATRVRGSKPPRPTLVPPDHRRAEGPSTGSGGSGSFFRACILLLLREQPGHGYDLLERLTSFGFDSGDSGWLYRTLRAFEREELVGSTWSISASGPPRRVYALTPRGAAQLDAWADSIRDGHRAIERFLGRQAAHKSGGGNDSG